jgi:hypothetical protein
VGTLRNATSELGEGKKREQEQEMKIQDFLSASDVALDVRANDKAGLLRELAGRAASTLNLSAVAVASEIEKRDELGSTGIGGGVSIPHARFREVKRPFGLLVRLKQPIDFDAARRLDRARSTACLRRPQAGAVPRNGRMQWKISADNFGFAAPCLLNGSAKA